MKLGIIGAGSMATALARGWAGSDAGLERLLISDAGSGRALRLAKETGAETASSNRELASTVDLVVLAMKPIGLDAVADEISGRARAVVSVLAGTSLARLASALPDTPIVRAMPNVAVEVGRGVVCWAASPEVDDPLRDRVISLLGLLGTELELEERLIDPATAVMGCSPAYVALFAEALTDAAVHEGIPEEKARLMVTESLAGTAKLLESRHTLQLRRSVTSPGGSTAAGLAALERSSLRAAVSEAVSASLERMRR